MQHVRQMTIGFLLLATIFGGVWMFRSSSDTVYSISKSAPEEGKSTDTAGDPPTGEEGAAGAKNPGEQVLGVPSPTLSPSPSASPSPLKAKALPAPKPAAKKPVPRKPATPPRQPARPTTADEAAKNRVVELVNVERAKGGCGPVHAAGGLNTAAQRHSADMVARNYFSHTTPDGVDPWQRARNAGYNTPTGENIAMGQRTAESVVESWMNSSGHRANILNCNSHAIGMGLARNSSGAPYWTQMFGSV